MVPEREKGHGKEWRVEVRAYHADRKPNFKVKKGMYVLLKDSYTERVFKIVSIRPLKGTNCKRLYSIPRKSLLREITRPELDEARTLYREHLNSSFPGEVTDENVEKIGDNSSCFKNDFLFQSSKKTVLQ